MAEGSLHLLLFSAVCVPLWLIERTHSDFTLYTSSTAAALCSSRSADKANHTQHSDQPTTEPEPP